MASQKIRDRIRRLREMTAGRGCTEAEALSAAEKAAQLMRDHGLSDADIVMDEQRSKAKNRGGSPVAALWPVIAYCTNTASIIIDEGGKGVAVSFVGREPGPAIAVYLRTVCERAVDRAIREFKTGGFYRRRRGLPSKRAAVNAFANAMVNRLSSRLVDVFGPTINDEQRDQAKSALAERYPDRLPVRGPRKDLRHTEAAEAGWAAGSAVPLSHGVSGGQAPRQIGGSHV